MRVKSREGDVCVSCGRCPPCRKARVDGWVFRLLQEEKRSKSAYFVTLTYDTDHVPITDNGFLNLDRKAFPAFIKRLRFHLGQAGIKYYAVGEYGSLKKRPHYHAIIYNLDPSIMRLVGHKNGQPQYQSDVIDQCWPFGVVDIGSCSGDSCAYVAKYINKPGRIPEHGRDDRIKEFSLMSKGLGSGYLTEQVLEYHREDPLRNFLTVEGGYKKAMPRYYRDRIYDDIDKSLQRAHIIVIKDEALERAKSDFHKKYGEDAEFDMHQQKQKNARYNQFMSTLQTRDLQ